MASSTEAEIRVSPRAAFEHRDFRFFQGARLLSIVATEIQSIAVAWQVYEATRRPIDLGYVGLAQFLPAILLFLVFGHTADRFDRRRILMLCHLSLVITASFLLWNSFQPKIHVGVVFAVLFVIGTIRGFSGPASQSIMPQMVPEEHFQNAVAWSSSIFMVSTIIGPAAGGLVYAIGRGAPLAFAVAAGMYFGALLLIAGLHVRTGRMETKEVSLQTLLAGFRYVWQQKIILGSISLDLFAVLLGGAVALLPVFASEILHVGAWGLGLLRSAPAVGAAMMGGVLAFYPLRRKSGLIMYWCVGIFGVATIIFGLSRTLWVSILALFLVGASDMVSVVIRSTLVQITTPPEMRGRVSAVNLLFIGASNEFGEFESGLTAQWLGAVRAVVLGGVGTLMVVGLWSWFFPELRKVEQLRSKQD